MEIKGEYSSAIIFTNNIEDEAFLQIKAMCNNELFENRKIRVMPDVHSGKGCVVGFTAELGNRVSPYWIGVDIGCGMYSVNLGRMNISFDKLDKFIQKSIPFGFNKNREIDENIEDKFKERVIEVCNRIGANSKEQLKSVGSLGSGNHFIEVDTDSRGNKWLIIHSGSRNFGLSVAEYYQKKAEEYVVENNFDSKMPFLEEELMKEYMESVVVAQEFASENRKIMANKIIKFLKADKIIESFETVHNYIDTVDNIIRKGAISAKADEKIVIPLNMRDGIIIAKGKGNSNWNCSAPHGAGRKMSRSKAKKSIEIDEFKKSMKNIWSSTVSEKTIDEAPQAYKPKKEIIDNISDTAEILEILIPVYNFKGC
jgi:tRNA-splicing ligase RtcB (3'-phosphate/5'-hydroxy nucleic acid ligase)